MFNATWEEPDSNSFWCACGHVTAFQVGYATIASTLLVATLDLECSDGETVLDPSMNATVRTWLGVAVSTTPATAASAGMSNASALFHDTFSTFKAGEHFSSRQASRGSRIPPGLWGWSHPFPSGRRH